MVGSEGEFIVGRKIRTDKEWVQVRGDIYREYLGGYGSDVAAFV